MIARENITMEWYGWNDFKYVIPIPKKIIEACPIEHKLNLNLAYETLLETLTYNRLKESVLYELSMRKKIYSAVMNSADKNMDYYMKSNLKKNISSAGPGKNGKYEKYYEHINKIFTKLNINPEKQRGLWNIIRHYMSSCNKETAETKERNIPNILLVYRENFTLPEYKTFIQSTLDEIFGLEPKKIIIRQDNFISRFLNPEEDRERFLTRFAFLDSEYGKINLITFRPDRSDYRNVMAVHELENYRPYLLNNLEMNQFDPNLFYDNPGRPFEDLMSAILGRELVITYLNKLEKII